MKEVFLKMKYIKKIFTQITGYIKDDKPSNEMDYLIDLEKKIKEKENNKIKTEEIKTVHVSSVSVFKAALIIAGVYFCTTIFVELTDILVLFLIALFLSSALNPLVDNFEKYKIPRGLSIILLFFVIFGSIAILLSTIVPIMAMQIMDIANGIEGQVRNFLLSEDKGYLNVFFANMDLKHITEVFNQNLESIAINLASFAERSLQIIYTTIGTIFSLILVLLLTFFLVIDKKNMSIFFQSLFPNRYQSYLSTKMHLVQKKIGDWMHGQILLFLIMGTISYIGLLIIGVDYALTLAMITGIAEFLPYIGPIIAFCTAAPIAFSESVSTGVFVIIFYAILQVVEGNILVPLVMKKSVGLPPIVTIIALIVGASFPNIINPIVGMIFAIPIATILSMFIKDYTNRETNKKSETNENH